MATFTKPDQEQLGVKNYFGKTSRVQEASWLRQAGYCFEMFSLGFTSYSMLGLATMALIWPPASSRHFYL